MYIANQHKDHQFSLSVLYWGCMASMLVITSLSSRRCGAKILLALIHFIKMLHKTQTKLKFSYRHSHDLFLPYLIN